MAVNSGERIGNLTWQTNSAETSMRLGMARLDNPTDKRAISGILAESKLPELGFFAKSLISNGTEYARNSLGWALDDARRNNIPVNAELAAAVQARLVRSGR